MIPLTISVSTIPPSGDGMADNYYPVAKFSGVGSTQGDDVLLGLNDGDTLKTILHITLITDTQTLSVHEDDDATSYQNTSGFDAMAVLVLNAQGSDGATVRNFKLYSSPNNNSTTSATLVYDFSTFSPAGVFDATNDIYTTPPVKIENNHYVVIENLSGSANSTFLVTGDSRIVERVE